MLMTLLKSKLHRLKVTEAHLYYEGSITLDPQLMDVAGLVPYEKVQVLNVNSGARLETYVIEGEAGSGVVCLNGPAARFNAPGDEVLVLSYVSLEPQEAEGHKPRIVLVDADNKPKDVLLGDKSVGLDG